MPEPTSGGLAAADQLHSDHDDALERLTEILAEQARQVDGPPIAVGFVPKGETFELAIKELLAGDPARELIGFGAPAEWAAFGVSGRSRIRDLTDGSVVEQDVGFAHVVSREGVQWHALLRAGDEAFTGGRRNDAVEGRIPDACRRVLGLPTKPPERDSRALMAAQWLDALAGVLLEDPRAFHDWDDVVMRNPVVEMFVEREPLVSLEIADHLAELGNAYRKAFPWSEVRARHARGEIDGYGLDAEGAAWMDDGIYSRWVLSSHPPMRQLLSTIGLHLPPSVQDRLVATLEGWAALD